MAPLSRQRIIATAVGMADRDGFEAVTLRRIAADLGVHVTSLYNHVATWDAVVDGMVEALMEEADLPHQPVGWEEWVRRFFGAIGAIAVAHPGAFTALHRRPVQGPVAADTFEVGLAAFHRAGFDTGDAYSALKATALTALAVGLERGMLSRGQLTETSMENLPPERFPEIRALGTVNDPERAWAFSLETLMAGLAAQLRRRKRVALSRPGVSPARRR